MSLETFDGLCGDFLFVDEETAQMTTPHIEWGSDWSDQDHNPTPNEIQIWYGVFVEDADIESTDDLRIFHPFIEVDIADNRVILTDMNGVKQKFVFVKHSQGQLKTIKLKSHSYEEFE